MVQLDGGVCCAPLSAAPLAESEAVELAKVFAALADPGAAPAPQPRGRRR